MASTLRVFGLSVSFAAAATAPVLAQGANDCIAAQPLKGYGTVPFSTVGATTDGLAEPLCNFFNQSNIFNDVWFRFTAPESTVVDIANCGAASFDTKIAVYGGADCASPVIACSDDNCGTQTRVTVGVTAGSQYLIRVGAYLGSATGSGSLTISPFTPLGEATDPSTGIRYVATAATTWTAAEAFALLLGGHLVSINDQAEQDFVYANFGNLGGVDRRIWIGFTDRDVEGTFAWSDGSPAKYANWNGGEPNNSGNVEDFAEMLGSTGKWNDLNDAGAGFPHIAVVELPGGGGGTPCPADLDEDQVVSATDLATLLAYWGSTFPGSDLNDDGITNAQDLAALLASWGPCPQ